MHLGTFHHTGLVLFFYHSLCLFFYSFATCIQFAKENWDWKLFLYCPVTWAPSSYFLLLEYFKTCSDVSCCGTYITFLDQFHQLLTWIHMVKGGIKESLAAFSFTPWLCLCSKSTLNSLFHFSLSFVPVTLEMEMRTDVLFVFVFVVSCRWVFCFFYALHEHLNILNDLWTISQ